MAPVLAIAGLLLWVTMVVTAAGVFRTAKPAYALKLAGFDARANAATAQTLLTANQAEAARATARRRAVAALKRDPTAVAAVTTLGLLAALDGDGARAERAFRYAERLTRRDPASQLWLIERRVRRNDIAGALAQYDTALRGSSSLRAQLYPILLSASADPAIARPLNRLLRGRPNWWQEYLSQLVWSGTNAEAVVTVSRGLLNPRVEDQRNLLSIMFSRVAAMGRPDLAWAAYREVVGQADASAPLRDGDFARDAGLPPFDWAYSEDSEFAPERRPREGVRGSFALYLPAASRDGEVARQLLRLPAGRHQITAIVGDVAAGAVERPYIKLACAAGNGEILNRPFPDARAAGVGLSASFAVSSNCPYQWISIGVRGNMDVRAEASPWIAELRIR